MAHVIDYTICGEGGSQYVIVELDPRETVIAEAGSMLYIDPGIEFEAKFGDGTSKGLMDSLLSAAKRTIAKESLFLTHFTNTGAGKQRVAIAAPHLGEILAIDLAQFNNQILCQQSSFIAAAFGTKVSLATTGNLRTGFFGGEGFFLTKLEGDGLVFVHAGGSLIERKLAGETLRVDTGCVVAMDNNIQYDITRAGSLRSMFLGGEGLFLATLSGHGTVWLQTMPFARIVRSIASELPGKAT